MKSSIIPGGDAAQFVRALGLLVNQAGIYGPTHNVTQLAIRSVFTELAKVVNTYGPVEIVLKDAQVLVNGSSEGLDAAVGKNLSDRMVFQKVGGLLFLPPADLREFTECIALIGTPAHVLADEGGLEEVLKKRALNSVHVVSVAYQRVAGKVASGARDKPKSLFYGADPVAPQAVGSVKPAETAELHLSDSLPGAARPGMFAEVRDYGDPAVSPETASYRERGAALAAMLRSAAEVLERGLDQGAAASRQEVVGVLDHIRDSLSEIAAGSRRDISILASQVEEDSIAIASIESAARRRGVGLKLTRGELIQRYAELNQEIVQPLTVSTGVIGLLSSGKVGALTEPQHELLKMAAESVERVNQLVAYMNRISGLPESFSPDMGLIADSYR